MAKIDEKYHKLLRHILKKGYEYEDPNRKGVKRIEVIDYKIEHNFKDGFPALTTKKLAWKSVVGELLWFLRGGTDIRELWKDNIHIWDKDWQNYKEIDDGFAKRLKSKTYDDHFYDMGRIYGAQWRYWGDDIYMDQNPGLDQISNLVKNLKKNPMGTKHIVTAWNPAELDDMALPPCHWSFEILVEPRDCGHHAECCDKNQCNGEDYQFTLKWHQRSVDTFLGLPFNITSYALLAHIIGKMTNMVPKALIGDLSNVHIYEDHLKQVKKQLSRDISNYDGCELYLGEMFEQAIEECNNLDDILVSIRTNDFQLKNYKSYPAIRAEMLAYNK